MSEVVASTIAGYQVLPIVIPPHKAYPGKVNHYLYVQPHEPKIPTRDDSRSLFLVNVPVDSTSQHFRAIFACLAGPGRFESITFERERQKKPTDSVISPLPPRHGKKRKRADPVPKIDHADTELPRVWDRDLHRSGSTAVALMADKASVGVILKAIRKAHKIQSFPTWGIGPDGKKVDAPALGLQRYDMHQLLTYPDPRVLQQSVDAFMTAFNQREQEAAVRNKRLRNEPDEDGFVTVTRGGRTGPARRDEAEEARKKEADKEEERRKSMGDFYRFQARERRKEEQNQLVKKFEEDRKMLETMRKQRKGKLMPEA